MNTRTKGNIRGPKPASPENPCWPWTGRATTSFPLLSLREPAGRCGSIRGHTFIQNFLHISSQSGRITREPYFVNNTYIGHADWKRNIPQFSLQGCCTHHQHLVRRNHVLWWSRSPETLTKDMRNLSSSERCLWDSRGIFQSQGHSAVLFSVYLCQPYLWMSIIHPAEMHWDSIFCLSITLKHFLKYPIRTKPVGQELTNGVN